MNENQAKIRKSVEYCYTMLGQYDQACDAFGKKKAGIISQPWVQEEKERLINQAEHTVVEMAKDVYNKIASELDQIREVSLVMCDELKLTPELNLAMMIISTAGDNLNYETRVNLIKEFVGNMQSLTVLKAALEKYNPAHPITDISRYIFPVSDYCDRLDMLAATLIISPWADVTKAVHIAHELQHFAELLGAEVGPFILADESAYFTRQLRLASGLSAEV